MSTHKEMAEKWINNRRAFDGYDALSIQTFVELLIALLDRVGAEAAEEEAKWWHERGHGDMRCSRHDCVECARLAMHAAKRPGRS